MNDYALILSADPAFVDLALAEVQQITTVEGSVALADGVWRVATQRPSWEVAEAWRAAPPIFVRHIYPAHLELGLRNKRETDFAILRQETLAHLASLVDPELTFSVQARVLAELPYKPFDLNQLLSTSLHESTGATIDVRAPQQILSVVCAAAPQPTRHVTHTAYVGFSLAVHNLSGWAGGMRRFARDEGQISRAEFKLLEALELFQIKLPSRGVALDLGASPGGWTRVLRQHDQYVTAVDPGSLDPRLAQDRGIRHKVMTAEQYLADEPDRFDLIVNDMRMDARDSARLMVTYAKQLYRHGSVIMTLKLPEEHREPIIEHAFAILREAYTVAGARQLFHNRSELTVYLTPRKE